MPTYGIDIERLDELVHLAPSGQEAGYSTLLALPEYTLDRLIMFAGAERELRTEVDQSATIFVEEGEIHADHRIILTHQLLHVAPSSSLRLRAFSPATVYLFRGAYSRGLVPLVPAPTFDVRSKYWGSIETIVNAEYTGKRLFFRKGQNSSLHFHCAKREAYFIHSGRLLTRLRAGRAEDRWFELPAGMILTIPPGLMHQSGALEDTIIIEVSSHDEDSDSFLVEDGQVIPMPRLPRVEIPPALNRGRIVFDLDGCLCSQTAGDYENAKPIPQAIALVNHLFDLGNEIVIHTSRFMGRCKSDTAQAYGQGFTFTEHQLHAWGVRYHLLMMGKPPADVVVDDRGVFFCSDWARIAAEIESKLSFRDSRGQQSHTESDRGIFAQKDKYEVIH